MSTCFLPLEPLEYALVCLNTHNIPPTEWEDCPALRNGAPLGFDAELELNNCEQHG